MFLGGTYLFVQHSLIHSHNFFVYSDVGRCASFVLGQQELNNCFWKIQVALRRASLV